MENSDIEPKPDVQEEQNKTIEIDLTEWMRIDSKNIVPDVSVVRYSNYAVVQVMQRDIYIDFLELPGVKRDGKVVVNTTRMYLTHSHAQKLAKSILEVLERSHKEHVFEVYNPKE